MTEVSKEAVDAFAKHVFGGDTELIMKKAAECVANLSAAGYTIAPVAQPVADEKLREAIKAVDALKYAILAADIRRENSTSAVSLEEARDVALIELNKLGYTIRRETMTEEELDRDARKLCTVQNVYWDNSQPTTHYMTEEAAMQLAKKYRG